VGGTHKEALGGTHMTHKEALGGTHMAQRKAWGTSGGPVAEGLAASMHMRNVLQLT